VLSGAADPLCTPEQSQSLAQGIAGAEALILEDCAHFPTLEQPELVTRALARWLHSVLDAARRRGDFTGSRCST